MVSREREREGHWRRGLKEREGPGGGAEGPGGEGAWGVLVGGVVGNGCGADADREDGEGGY